MRAILSVVLAGAGLLAQNQTVVLPTQSLAASNNLPFAGGIARYQQWHSPGDFAAALSQLPQPLTGPLRVLQLDFFGAAGQQVATTLDLEVSMGHALATGLTGFFDNDFLTPPVTVVPRRTVNLGTGTGVVLTLPFLNQFTWNGTDAVLVQVKVFGNGQANQNFPHSFRSTSNGFGRIVRAYSLGNASATLASSVQAGWGLFASFTVRPGAMVPFGDGCPGQGGVTPVNTILNLASPGVLWQHQVTSAPSQQLAMWIIGDSRTAWGPEVLPLDLGPRIGATGCFLLTNPVASQFTLTVGGGPGAGLGSVQVPLPPTTSYVGAAVYTQWFVADPLGPNGVLAATRGMWTVVAPLGG